VSETNPVENKVKAATVGAGTGAVVSTFFVWLLDEYLWKNGDVPDPVSGMVYLLVGAGLTFWAGYRTKNTVE